MSMQQMLAEYITGLKRYLSLQGVGARMTEYEWQTSNYPAAMLECLRRWPERGAYSSSVSSGPPPEYPGLCRWSNRLLRLFACACCRAVWPQLTDPRSRAAVETAERFADGEATAAELNIANTSARVAWNDAVNDNPTGLAYYVSSIGSPFNTCLERITSSAFRHIPDHATQAGLLRDIFGNPFRPVTFAAPSDVQFRSDLWGHIYAMVRTIYAERLPSRHLDPVRLVVLADALEEAECTDEVVLMLLRGQRKCPDCQGKGRLTASVIDFKGYVLPVGSERCRACKGRGLVTVDGLRFRGFWPLDVLQGKE